MRVVCTLCSRVKSKEPGFMPAYKRYLGAHIQKVKEIAKEKRAAFFIVSGKFGFIPADEMIPCYDFVLSEEGVSDLTLLIGRQLQENGVTEVHFYTKSKPPWSYYSEALTSALQEYGAELHVYEVLE